MIEDESVPPWLWVPPCLLFEVPKGSVWLGRVESGFDRSGGAEMCQREQTNGRGIRRRSGCHDRTRCKVILFCTVTGIPRPGSGSFGFPTLLTVPIHPVAWNSIRCLDRHMTSVVDAAPSDLAWHSSQV